MLVMNQERGASLMALLARTARALALVILSSVFAVTACSSGEDTPARPASSTSSGATPDTPDPTEAMFDPDHVLDVVIDMAPADWDALRHQSRNIEDIFGEDCQSGPLESPYTYFPATVTVDGTVVEKVAVRKKGLLGSASLSKPSLKINFDKNVPDQEVGGLDEMTLNNAQQDPALIKQCLAYKLFHDAGVPASRCSFARVTVNGAALGVYAHVEGVDKPLLRRFFDDDSGNLYEGQLSDFRPGWSATYQKKTNEKNPDRSDLDALTNAIMADDAALEETLGGVLDIDAFMTFWAMESLTAAWDGYTNNLNNHFVYNDPTSGKMRFLPWGLDMVFDEMSPLDSAGRPQSVSANGAIPHRLYARTEYRAAYAARMKELLDSVWKEDAILKEIDRMEALLKPHVGASEPDVSAAVQKIRGFVSGRRATIEAELSPAPVEWPYPLRSAACFSPVGTMSGSFSTTWGTLPTMDAFMTGTGKLEYDELPEGMPLPSEAMGAASGPEEAGGARAQLVLVGAFPDGKVRLLILYVDPTEFASGKDLPFDWQTVFGFAMDITEPNSTQLLGLFGKGSIHLDQASMKPGEPVTGSFTAELVGGAF